VLLVTDPWLSPLAGVVDALGDQPRERIARYDRLWRDDGFEYTPS
jgi:hypothetical protein